MADELGKAVRVSAEVGQVKHPVKAAKMLFSSPPYILRGPIYLVCIITVVGVIYSFIGEKSEIVQTILTLKSDSFTVQAPVGGIVNQMFIEEGSVINGGGVPLVNIQFKTQASMDSETESLKNDLERIDREIGYMGEEDKTREARLSDLKQLLSREQDNIRLLEDRIEGERKDLAASLESADKTIKSIRLGLNIQSEQKKQQQQQIDFLEKTLAKVKEQFAETQKLFEKKLITKPELDAKESNLNAATKDFENSKSQMSQLNSEYNQESIKLESAINAPADINRNWEQRRQQHAKERAYSRDRVSELTSQIKQAELGMEKGKEELLRQKASVEEKIKESLNLIRGVSYEGELCKLASIFGGKVLEVFVKPGELITSGQPLFRIKRETDLIYAEILVNNRDIGRLKREDKVQIKYEAYPYQNFGIQSGKIKSIPSAPTTLKDIGSVYVVQVALDATAIKVRGKPQPLALGLQGWGEIEVGSKKLIEIIFSPLSKFLSPEDVQ